MLSCDDVKKGCCHVMTSQEDCSISLKHVISEMILFLHISVIFQLFALRAADGEKPTDTLKASSSLTDTTKQRHKRFSIFDKLNRRTISQELDPILSAETEAQWVKFIADMHNDYLKEEDSVINFSCQNPVSTAILEQFPKASVRWMLNEDAIILDPTRMIANRLSFVIRNLRNSDTGLYLCLINYRKEDAKVVGIYSLTVTSQTVTFTTKETGKMELSCNSNPLQQTYPSARIEWFHGNKSYNPEGVVNETLVIPKVIKSDTGIWRCRVFDADTGRKWHTAWYRVDVGPPPSVYARALRLAQDNKLNAFLVLLGVSLVIVLFLAGCAFKGIKAKEKDAKTTGMMKQQMLTLNIKTIPGVQLLESDSSGDSSSSADSTVILPADAETSEDSSMSLLDHAESRSESRSSSH